MNEIGQLMHKKLAADLSNLAHQILQMKNKDDVKALKKKAHQIYEKLSVLDYVEEYVNTTPQATETKESLLKKIENVSEKDLKEAKKEIKVIRYNLEDSTYEAPFTEEQIVEKAVEENSKAEGKTDGKAIFEDVKDEVANNELKIVEKSVFDETKEAKKNNVSSFDESTSEKRKTISLEDELKDTVAVDIVADLFENAQKKSLNDRLQGDIQIGLNDRIAFVKNLFDGSQEDFNRVISQLNTFKTESEVKNFIYKMVKPDYDWTEKEEFEERFITLIQRKFV